MIPRLTFLALTLSIASAADARTVQQFIVEAERARSAGMQAALDGSIRSLMSEADVALAAWKAQQTSARPKVCAPPGSENMPPSEFMGVLQSIPVQRRATTLLKEGVVEALNRRHRCRAAR